MQRTKIARLTAGPRGSELTPTPTPTPTTTRHVWRAPRGLSDNMLALIGSWLTPNEILHFLRKATVNRNNAVKYSLLEKEWSPALKSSRQNVWFVEMKLAAYLDPTPLLLDIKKILLRLMLDGCDVHGEDTLSREWCDTYEIPIPCAMRWLEKSDKEIVTKLNAEVNRLRETLSTGEGQFKNPVRSISRYADSRHLTITVDYIDEEMDIVDTDEDSY